VTDAGPSQTPAAMPGLTEVSAIVMGGWSACAMHADRAPDCWRGGDAPGTIVPGVPNFGSTPQPFTEIGTPVTLSIGAGHACAIEPDRTLVCWGDNRAGQLTAGVSGMGPGPVRGITGVVEVSAGNLHTCALDGAGAIWCWGHNGEGELGDGTTIDRGVPTRVDW
jgi:hypothetical protein